LRDRGLMQHYWALGHKEGWPLPEEKVVALRKTQLRFLFEASDLCLDSGELTLKSRDGPSRSQRPFRFLGFHNAPHVRSPAIAPPKRKCLAIQLAMT
jgi:hypothetical protein